MKTTRGLTLTALALMMAACQDAPTFPALEIETSQATVETAMDQAATLAQAVVEESLADVPSDSVIVRPTDRRRPDDHRPDRRRPDDHRPDGRRPDDRRPDRGRAELAVALSGEAVALASRLLQEQGADEEQKRLLQKAEELHRKAEAALEEGRDAAAVDLAHAATVTSLKALVLPGGITAEEARMIHDLAADLLPQARAAVAANPTALNRHLLAVAEKLFRQGSDKLSDPDRSTRGVVPLWKSAVISSYLIG